MNKTSILLLLLVLALAACNRDTTAPASRPAGQTKPPASAKVTAAKPATAAKRQPSAEEISQIVASRRTGLWADVESVCAKEPRPKTTLSWNVADSGARKVVLYLVEKDGKERNFGQGGAIGSRKTGPWLKPGLGFKIREAGTKKELGSIVIADKHC